MAKLDFNNSMFARFFADGEADFVQTYLDTAALLQVRYAWWQTQARKAGTITPTAADGSASFTVKAKKAEVAPMADLLSRNGDTMPLDHEGFAWYSASIPDLAAPGIVENALERHQKEMQYEMFGNDADIISQWTDKVQTQLDSLNSSLSYMTAQLISNGSINYDAGRGAHSVLQKAPIDAANFVNAGKQAWSVTSCQLLDQMAEIENDFREKNGIDGAMVWKIPYDMFHKYFMKNEQVLQWIKDTRTYNEQATTNNMVIPEEEVLRYISMYPSLSPIEIVKEKVRNLTQTTDIMVHGWNQNHAVLCPAGYVAEIQYTDMLRLQLINKYGSDLVKSNIASLQDGLFSLVNLTLNNGQYKEWHTDVFMSCVPSLTQFPYHLIVDTTATE